MGIGRPETYLIGQYYHGRLLGQRFSSLPGVCKSAVYAYHRDLLRVIFFAEPDHLLCSLSGAGYLDRYPNIFVRMVLQCLRDGEEVVLPALGGEGWSFLR